MHDPEILTVPEDHENNENISTRDVLKAPDAEQFKEAVRKKVWDLTKGPPHPNTIVLLVETRLIEELRDGARRTSSRKRTRPQSNINESYSEGEINHLGGERRTSPRQHHYRTDQRAHAD